MRRDRARAALWLVAGWLSVSCVLPKYSVVDALPGGGGGQGAGGKPGAGDGGAGGGAGDGGGGAPTDGGVDAATDRGGDAAADQSGEGGVVTPVCGDRVCSPGETQAGCCDDCGCPAGRYCFLSTCSQPTAVMTWSFDDNCADQRGIQSGAVDSYNSLRRWSSAGFVTGAVLAATGIVILATSPRRVERDGPTVGLRFGVVPGGAFLRGNF